MTEPERMILGWCLERGEVPACVAAIPVDALSGPAAVIRGLLVELQGMGMTWGPVDLYLQMVAHDPRTAEIGRWLTADEVLLLPAVVPATLTEVATLCDLLTGRHHARIVRVAALRAEHARAEEARLQTMALGCAALRQLWGPRERREVRCHPAWREFRRAG